MLPRKTLSIVSLIDQGIPYKVFLTDITYLPYGSGQWAYLSAVKDGATGEIVAHHFSTSLKMNLVYETLDKLNNVIKDMPVMERYIHSDQGVHYTYPVFQEKVLYRLHPSHLDSF